MVHIQAFFAVGGCQASLSKPAVFLCCYWSKFPRLCMVTYAIFYDNNIVDKTLRSYIAALLCSLIHPAAGSGHQTTNGKFNYEQI